MNCAQQCPHCVELRAVKAALELEFERLTAEHAALIEQSEHLTDKNVELRAVKAALEVEFEALTAEQSS
jgi:cell division protein FtsL